MKLVIGTDEAGYGPNLGPLVVAGTAWSLNSYDGKSLDLHDPVNWFQAFGEPFVPFSRPSGDGIRVGDSKKIYQSGSGLSELEKLVFSLLYANDTSQRSGSWTWKGLLETLLIDFEQWETAGLPWNEEYDPMLPQDLDVDAAMALANRINLNEESSRPLKQLARLVEPQQFNQGIETWGNKASLLSQVTFSVIGYLMDSLIKEQGDCIDGILVYCDKHGGRSRYAGILQSVFSDTWIQVLEELPELSRYAFSWKGLPVQMEFRAKGESELPIATASMFAKYLREISMQALNRFWASKISGLRPTAGYPVDAKRFRSEISDVAAKDGIADSIWWRSR